MKKIIMALLIVVLAVAGAAAQGKPYMDKGDSAVMVGIDAGNGLGIGGGYEVMLHRWDISNVLPLTFGVAGRVGLDFTPSFTLAVAGLGTAHFAFTAFKDFPDWVQKFEWRASLGLGLGLKSGFGLGIAGGTGVAYYLDPKTAIILDDIYANYFLSNKSSNIAILGVQLKM